MNFPTGAVAVPDIVKRIAAGRSVTAVWVNEIGGTTFSVGDGAEYVKVYPAAEAHHLVAEEQRLAWAAGYVRVPVVLSSGSGGQERSDSGSGSGSDSGGDIAWMHTAGLSARSAVDPQWVAQPVVAARAIGAGLRLLHDSLPVADCPFGRPSWVPADAPPADRQVVCHGDACAPNTLIGDDGRCAGHVDVGDLGVADRWSDLAVATLSLGWNYPTIHEDVLFEAYGVAPDRERIAYYRLRWEE